MKNSLILLNTAVLLFLLGCQGGSGATAPPISNPQTMPSPRQSGNTSVLGFYAIEFDPITESFDVLPSRTSGFTANITRALEGPVPKILIEFYGFVDNVLDLDLTIVHPFPGYDIYTGFDLRFVFIGDGSETASWNPDLKYPGPDDQKLLNFDGYTRWFNPTEFNGDMPILSYYPGQISTPGFTGSATLMPYKYYADGLEPDGDVWNTLTHPDYIKRGSFPTTISLTRNHLIEFPPPSQFKFNYAVVVCWEPNNNFPDPPGSIDDFPISANSQEAVAFNIDTDDSTLWWNPDGSGGTFIADISIFDWSATASGAMDEYVLKLASDIFSTTYEFSPMEMTPVGEGVHYYTYHVETPPGLLTANDQELWVIVEYPDFDYSNGIGVLNDADGPLQAFFHHEFTIAGSPDNSPPEILSGVDGPAFVTICDFETYSVAASDPDADPLTYTWSIVPDGDPDDFNISGEDEDMDINWGTWGEGLWKVNCEVSDGINPPVCATPLIVEVIYDDCCPDVTNAAYPYTTTPTTADWKWALTIPATSGDTFSESTIDMDFIHDDKDRLVVSCRTLHRIACVTPVMTDFDGGINYSCFVTEVDAMSIDVSMDNLIVYVEFDNSVMDDVSYWPDTHWPTRTKAIEGADTEFHVYDIGNSVEIGLGYDVGAQIMAVETDEYGNIWVMDTDNEMHCFVRDGDTYIENPAKFFDMDENGSNMEGLVYDFAIDFYNECFYILTNGVNSGMLYRVECDGEFNPVVEGNLNPLVGLWEEKVTDKADIIIDNFDSSGNILDGGQDAQIICLANIEMGYNPYAAKIGITRVDAALGNKIWYLFEGHDNTGYGATCATVNGITNTMYSKCGSPYGNQYIVQTLFVPTAEWY